MITFKTVKKYKELTVTEALEALAKNDGMPLENMAFRNSKQEAWYEDTLEGAHKRQCFDVFVPEFITGEQRWSYCAEVMQVDPRKTPSEAPDFTDENPYLFYAGTGRELEHLPDAECDDYRWASVNPQWLKDQFNDRTKYGVNGPVFFAIDVRSEYAREHFPDIVNAALILEDHSETIDAWIKEQNIGYDAIKSVARDAFELGVTTERKRNQA